MKANKKSLVAIAVLALLPAMVSAEIISTPANKGPYDGSPKESGGVHGRNFMRGMYTTRYCGNGGVESWVRGSATLNTATGDLGMTVQLETDDTVAGPKGKMIVEVKDVDGHVLATATTSEFGMGGKPPGHAKINDFSGSAKIPQVVAAKATSLDASVQCTGYVNQLWGIDSGKLIHAVNVVVSAMGLASSNNNDSQ